MTTTEILKLGIKGADLVFSTLKKIQQEKQKFAKAAQTRVSLGKSDGAPSGQDLAANRFATGPTGAPGARPEESKEEKKKETAEKGAAERWQKVGQAANTIFQGAASLSTSGLISSIGSALSETFAIGPVLGIAATLSNAALTFKDKIKAAAADWMDTVDARNTASQWSRGDSQFLRAGDQSRKGRADISTAEQRGIMETLGPQFGRFTTEFKDALHTLYNNGKQENYDVRQTTALAQGNFESLGTDQGFFMQKLADSVRNLPPSARQAIMPQLWSQIPEEDRMKQSAELTGMRNANVNFNDQDRMQSSAMLNAGSGMQANLQYASQLQGIQNSIDTGLAAAASGLVTGFRNMEQAIRIMSDDRLSGTQKLENIRQLFPTSN